MGYAMTASITNATFKRHNLPAIPAPGAVPINQHDTYAVIRCGDACAEIVRFAHWHPNDGVDTVEVSFEARLHNAGDHADMPLTEPRELFDLAHVATRAAFLLDEAQRRHVGAGVAR